MLNNGPGTQQSATTAFVAGDSAGGNLTLALLTWLRDQGMRAPDAALALSPVTDLCLQSTSLTYNQKTDRILGPMARLLTRIPLWLLISLNWYWTRVWPTNAQISPLYGNLSGLPPVLIQVSADEVLLDDARRYTNKTLAAGSPIRLQIWPHMMHVWQIFTPQLPEAEHAFFEIARFFRSYKRTL